MIRAVNYEIYVQYSATTQATFTQVMKTKVCANDIIPLLFIVSVNVSCGIDIKLSLFYNAASLYSR